MNNDTKTFNYIRGIRKERIKKLVFEFICGVLFIVIVMGLGYIKDLNSQLDEAKKELVTYETNDKVYKIALEVNKETLSTLNNELNETIAQSEKIIAQNKELTERLYLYDSYQYALIDSVGNRTDITEEQLRIGTELMSKEGIDPNMLFSIIMIESGGNEDAANPTSTARGYCQLLKGTGQTMYGWLGYDSSTYNHEQMARNGNLNIRMGCALLTYLMDRYDGSVVKTLNTYSGGLSNSYYNKFVNYLAKGGSSVPQIEARYAKIHVNY